MKYTSAVSHTPEVAAVCPPAKIAYAPVTAAAERRRADDIEGASTSVKDDVSMAMTSADGTENPAVATPANSAISPSAAPCDAR